MVSADKLSVKRSSHTGLFEVPHWVFSSKTNFGCGNGDCGYVQVTVYSDPTEKVGADPFEDGLVKVAL